MKILILLTSAIFLIGCTASDAVKPICPKVKVKTVSLKVNKSGGLDKGERIKAFRLIGYYTNENIRTNKAVDFLNSK